MTTTLLVFGADGQLGREIARAPLPAHLRHAGVSWQVADLLDPGSLDSALRAAGPCVAVNAAAFTHVDAAEKDPEAAWAVNALGAASLARACAAACVPLLHISTDYVFDGTKGAPYREDDRPSPLNQYGRSKEGGERLVREAHSSSVILRTAWLFSPFRRNFAKTMLELGRTRTEISVVDDQTGSPTPVKALAQGVIAIAGDLARGRTDAFGTYHAAGAEPATWHTLAAALFDEATRLGYKSPQLRPIPTTVYPTPARRPAFSVLDSRAMETAFGLAPIDWRRGVVESVRDILGERP